MAKQLLFYENAVPVSAARHADLSIETGAGYAFASHASAVPIMALEFIAAASEYAIVFAPIGDEIFPAVVLGLRTDQNLYLDQNAKWDAKYVPAFIRRYPFVFSTSADRKTLTLCIDESYTGLNREGKGERLFDEERKPAAYTQRVLKFLQDFQAHFQRTRLFCQRLKELGLLEPTGVQVTAVGGEKMSLGGFLVVNRKKLRSVPDDKLLAMAKSDELELLHLHLYSLRNFAEMKDRLIGSLAAEADEAAAAPVLQ
ncbi:MAG: SapC family protein [Pseudomonadota bacterium]